MEVAEKPRWRNIVAAICSINPFLDAFFLGVFAIGNEEWKGSELLAFFDTPN
jgi:hypothetical protein